MSNILENINTFINSDRYTHTTINYDLNAIKIRLHADSGDEPCIFLYIYQPWRIIINGMIVNSSCRCPIECEDLAKEGYRKAFADYCASTTSLSKKRITDVSIQQGSNDLLIRWDDGTLLQTFNTDHTEWAYHIYDKVNGRNYDICYNKMEEHN